MEDWDSLHLLSWQQHTGKPYAPSRILYVTIIYYVVNLSTMEERIPIGFLNGAKL